MQKQGNTKKVTLSPKDVRKPALKRGRPADAIRADLRRREAVNLRLAGCTFREIGEELGVSEKTATFTSPMAGSAFRPRPTKRGASCAT